MHKRIHTAFIILLLVAANQSIAQIPENIVKYFSKADTSSKTQQKQDTVFFNKLKDNAYKKWWTREIYDLTVKQKSRSDSISVSTIRSDMPFQSYQGKTIRTIRLKRLNVVEQCVNDTIINCKSKIGQWANNFHVKTRAFVIRNNLVFEKGDTIDAFEFADNERILRELSFINDAKILIIDTSISDSVDVLVITKDKWSIGFNLEAYDHNIFHFGIWDRNLGGLGYNFSNQIRISSEAEQKIKYSRGRYDIKNIKASFINAKLFYDFSVAEYEKFGLRFDRDFIRPEIKYAGGLLAEKNYSSPDSLAYSIQNIWIGRSFDISKNNPNKRRRFIFANSFSNSVLQNSPELLKDSINREYHYKTYLSSFSILESEFYSGKLIYKNGITEAIPSGYLLQLTSGWLIQSDKTRFYSALRFMNGHINKNKSIIQSDINFGGYFENNKIENGFFDIKFDYISKLRKLRNARYRNFFKTKYLIAFNKTNSEYVNIFSLLENNNLDDTPISRGTQRFELMSGSRIFTPVQFYGFNVSLVSALNIGLIGSENTLPNKLEFFSALSLGIILRNDNLVFDTFVFSLSYYPIIPENTKNIFIDFNTREDYGYRKIEVSQPKIFDIQ